MPNLEHFMRIFLSLDFDSLKIKKDIRISFWQSKNLNPQKDWIVWDWNLDKESRLEFFLLKTFTPNSVFEPNIKLWAFPEFSKGIAFHFCAFERYALW